MNFSKFLNTRVKNIFTLSFCYYNFEDILYNPYIIKTQYKTLLSWIDGFELMGVGKFIKVIKLSSKLEID